MFDRVNANLQAYMDLLSFRQKLVASNLANLDTPGYKTRDIDFQFEFQTRIKDAQPHIVELDLPSKNDGNNVSLDREARLLAENAMRFQLASLLAREEFRKIKSAIQEGK
ncbi:MAG: flagellar basal body protein [Bryobacteraceae bacterium]|nr:flagellar basal body protein [Bryobacteraceae bacterium]MDW8376750.1 flagellar basal body protein [Bryobacterales bacterium]